jgi:hypothetical protein
VFALAPDGRLLGEFAVSGARAVDWEDIAIGRSPDGTGEALYVGDTGDNAAQRPEIVVYVAPEPQARGGAGATAPARRVALRYPGAEAHDAEALLVDPATGRIVIVTKSLGGEADVYVAPRRLGGGTATLRRTGSLALGFGQPVTDASLSADGRTVVLRTYDRALVFTRRRGEMLSAALRRRPCAADVSLASEGQGEAVALARDGRSFYTVPEGTRPAIRRYAPAPGR